MSQHIQQSELVFERICLKMPILLNCLEFFSSFQFVCVHNSVNNAVWEAFFIYEYLGCPVWPISKSREILFWHHSYGVIADAWVEINRESVIFKTVIYCTWHMTLFICKFLLLVTIFIRTWHQSYWWKTLWRKAFVKATWQFGAVKFHWIEQHVLHL